MGYWLWRADFGSGPALGVGPVLLLLTDTATCPYRVGGAWGLVVPVLLMLSVEGFEL